MLKEKIQAYAHNYHDRFIEIRHHLHAHPELSYKEFKTSEFIQQKLNEFLIPFNVIAGTGVAGIIKGKNPDSRVIALRADMDALPIKFILQSKAREGMLQRLILQPIQY